MPVSAQSAAQSAGQSVGQNASQPAGASALQDLYHGVLISEELHLLSPKSNRVGLASTPSGTGQQWQVTLTAMGRDFKLTLEPSGITSEAQFVAPGGKPNERSQPSGLQLFKGTVDGDDQSWVRLTRHQGMLTGHLFVFGELLQIERVDALHKYPAGLIARSTTKATSTTHHLQTATVMLKSPELEALAELIHGASPFARPAHANLDYLLFAPDAEGAKNTEIYDNLLSNNVSAHRTNQLPVTRAIRIGIVVDSLFDEYHDNRGVAHALTIINAVDGIYQQQLGLAIVVDTVRANTNPASDPMRNNGGSIEQILDNFRVVRVFDNQLAADLTLVHLFTGLRDPDSVIGLGWINTACRTDGYDVSVSTPFAFDTLLAAHEMAHNLGALHDDSPRCDSNRTSIMWPRLSGGTDAKFSHCSKNAIAPNIAASCNLDNIDLAVGLQASAVSSNSNDQRRVTMKLRNNDPNRHIDNVSIVARFPSGSRIADIPSYCTTTGLQLRCNLDRINADTTDSVSARITLGNTQSSQWVQLSVIKENFADTNDGNNVAALDILRFGSTGASSTVNVAQNGGTFNDSEQTLALNNQGQAQTNGGGASGDAVGSVKLGGLAVLALMLALRQMGNQMRNQRRRPRRYSVS